MIEEIEHAMTNIKYGLDMPRVVRLELCKARAGPLAYVAAYKPTV